jgi:5'-3' exonuclease
MLLLKPKNQFKGMDTSAIMGFMNSLMDVIKREKPDHLAVAFDKGGSQLRNDIFPEYKAHRDTPEAIKNSSSLHSGFTKSHAHSYHRSSRL